MTYQKHSKICNLIKKIAGTNFILGLSESKIANKKIQFQSGQATTSSEARGLGNLCQLSTASGLRNLSKPTAMSRARGLTSLGQPTNSS